MVRRDASHRFSRPWVDGQVQILLGLHPVQREIPSKFADCIVEEVVAEPRFEHFLRVLFRDPAKEAILEAYFQSDPGIRRRCLSDPTQASTLVPNLRTYFQDYSSKIDRTIPLQRTGDGTQVCGPVMHWTFMKRQADSNLLLNRYFQKASLSNYKYNALFVGGSLGITAVEFLNALDESMHERWNVISADLFPPERIFERLKSECPPDAPYAKMERFPTLSSIEYLCMDMKRPCFSPGSVALLDACNVLGYVESVNDRLDIVQNLWSLVQVGGWMRLVSPSLESIFEQMVVQKTPGHGFEIVYVSLTGKTVPAGQSPEDRFADGQRITKAVQALRTSPLDVETLVTEEERAVLDDLRHLSPLRFGAGVIDSYRMLPGRLTAPYEVYAKEVRDLLFSLESKL